MLVAPNHYTRVGLTLKVVVTLKRVVASELTGPPVWPLHSTIQHNGSLYSSTWHSNLSLGWQQGGLCAPFDIRVFNSYIFCLCSCICDHFLSLGSWWIRLIHTHILKQQVCLYVLRKPAKSKVMLHQNSNQCNNLLHNVHVYFYCKSDQSNYDATRNVCWEEFMQWIQCVIINVIPSLRREHLGNRVEGLWYVGEYTKAIE